MNPNKQEIISKIEMECPDFMTTRMLINLGLGNHNTWHHQRRYKHLASFQSKGKGGRLYYKKADVIQWIKRYYTVKTKSGAPKEEVTEAHKSSNLLRNFLGLLGMK